MPKHITTFADFEQETHQPIGYESGIVDVPTGSDPDEDYHPTEAIDNDEDYYFEPLGEEDDSIPF